MGRPVATVTVDTLRIRKEPAADATVYDLAARGEIFRIVDAGELEFSDGIRLNADWAAVDYEGRTGYVSADYITVVRLWRKSRQGKLRRRKPRPRPCFRRRMGRHRKKQDVQAAEI